MAAKSKNLFNAINLGKPTTVIKQAKSEQMLDAGISGSIVITAPETLHQFHFVYSGIFQHKPSHLLTWYSNDGVNKAQIDFILVRQRWRSSVQDSRSYNGVDSGSQSGSDHRLVAAKILLRLAIRRKNKSKVGFNIGKLQDKEVRQALNLGLTNQFDALSSDENLTPNKRWEPFKTVMTETADEILGRAKIKRQHWITARTLSIVSEQRQKMGGLKEETKELRRQVKRSVRLDRRQMWEDAAESLEKAACLHDTRKLYQILKESVGKKAAVSKIIKNRSGKIISCQKERSARWKDHFQLLLNPSPSSAHEASLPSVSKEPYDIELDTPTTAEILKAIKTLKSHQAPGEDGLPPELYKQCPEVTVEQLHGILEEVWRTNTFLKDWKTSVILPFYKKGDKTECKNYHGISLIDIAVKIFGIILLNRFKGAREERTQGNQAGF
ncbi:uncharacterized protein LOC136042877 [Artemia franciscana]|uniref:uncharacterized protein LOC136042877 n=1 Tax=Artemia franciscana TaxID=6661 RepID=UPI0032D9EA6E